MAETIMTPEKPRSVVLEMPRELEPPQTLWQRIEAQHVRRERRRSGLRYLAVSAGVAVAIGGALVERHLNPSANAPAEVDWQARAQALELELHSLAQSDSGPSGAAADEPRAELARIDRSLQAAYDHGAGAMELAPLWKRRSELLNALITAHEQRLAVTRI